MTALLPEAEIQIGPDVQAVMQTLARRKAECGIEHEMSRLISQTYGGHIAIATPQIDKNEPLSVANFLAQGIDQYALRIASAQAEISYFSTSPGKVRADQAARDKRRVSYGWWYVNDMDSIDEVRARHIVAYAKAPVQLRPDWRMRQPKWEPRTPLETFPSTPRDSLDIHPDDTIFVYLRTFGWLLREYPDQAMEIASSRTQMDKPKPEDTIEVVEWVDDTSRVLIAVGQGRPAGVIHEAEYGIQGAVIYNLSGEAGPNHWAIELKRVRNRADVCPVVIPKRLALDGIKGQFDDALGIFQLLAKVQAANVNAIAKGVWPDTWLVKHPDGTGKIIKVADGLKGEIGEHTGAGLQVINEQPSPQVMNMLNYLERAIRLDGQIPAQFGGEAASNVRTDRQSLSTEGATVDFFLAAYQKAFARSKKVELEIAQAIDMAYFGNTKKSFFVAWKNTNGRVDYKPNDLWTDGARDVDVSYAFLGLDANAATVRQGQLVGMGAMSLDTVRYLNPDWIRDKELERGKVWGDKIDNIAMQQMLQPGAIQLPDIATVKQLVIAGMPIEEALLEVQKRAQARQASSGPPGTPEGAVPAGSPEAQPGIAQPGMGAEQPVIAQPGPNLQNYRKVLQELGNFRSAANQ